ncbi:MAG: hypothetical protein JNM41_16355 [Flavipsychrobacter sp.]|nr:hypothetical protein [Flavipsychrobacter sp.]
MTQHHHRYISTIFMALLPLFFCAVFAPVEVSAQVKKEVKRSNVRLANEERNMISVRTILANPKLISAKASCEVTGFTISFLPEGGNLYGPFKTEGSAIKPEHCKYLKENAEANVKIFIEHIRMSCNGTSVDEMPIVIRSFP